MQQHGYLMESEEEAYRLDQKTSGETVEKQALWAGIKPGMRVADLGCGPGKTTYHLNKLVQPKGETIGVDVSQQRISYAKQNYHNLKIQYIRQDIRNSIENLKSFDFIWIRFVLEYYRSEAFEIVENISNAMKPGGILCLIDLDHNCLNHYGLPLRLESALFRIMKSVEKYANFDPYVGRKLYSFIYDLGYSEIEVKMEPHHLIFGKLNDAEAYNWTKKVEAAGKKSGYLFEEFQGGFEEFFEEFKLFFNNPRRFTYTPVIACRGRKL